MPEFYYEAIDAQGQEYCELIEAETRKDAERAIREQGRFVTRIILSGEGFSKQPTQLSVFWRKLTPAKVLAGIFRCVIWYFALIGFLKCLNVQ